MAVTVGDPDHGGGGLTSVEPAVQLLAKSVAEGKCILFIGAGVHHCPPDNSKYSYAESDRPPMGGALAQELALECNFAKMCPGEQSDNLQRVALCYEKTLGRQALIDRIRQAVEQGRKPSAALRALAELRFPLVMTTNYDTLFERALRQDHVGKDPFTAAYSPDRYERTTDYAGGDQPTDDRPFVFKVHGDINTPKSIVVTDEDYITFVCA